MNRNTRLLAGILLASLVLAACAGPAATSAPTAPSATEAPTTAPAAGAAVTMNLWHGLTGPEEQTMAEVIQNFETANPNITINTLAVPFNQLQNKYTTDASTGGGPDLLYGPKDWIGTFAQAQLIVPLDDIATEVGMDNLSQAAVMADQYQGQTWALPESTEAVALWYNTDKVTTPPANSDELLSMAPDVGLALNTLFYYGIGFIYAEGGQLFDSNYKCILDQGNGAIEALNFLKTANGTQGVTASSNTADLDAAFTGGTAGLIFEGPWGTGTFVEALGADKLAIAPPLVMQPNGKPFAPFLGTKNFYLNANSTGDAKDAAIKFMNYITQPESQLLFATKAGHIPANPNVQLTDPILDGFLKQTLSSSYFPNEPEMGAVWTPAGDMITKVIDGSETPEAAVTEATDLINKANNK
ncbi:MAG: extracellular solute-binding protein [Anaerolineales bacterium]|jgi:arabinogalactan oligomer/maltooligosaccharide transport system substrate-binding protein